MSSTELYSLALKRFAISLILTIADALICPMALYNTFGDWVMFALVLLLMVPWAWSLGNIWLHTFRDLMRIQKTLAVRDYDDGVAIADRNV